jgi:murein DD-endopeptidase MepM/ murein hydrolase activator NlpD
VDNHENNPQNWKNSFVEILTAFSIALVCIFIYHYFAKSSVPKIQILETQIEEPELKYGFNETEHFFQEMEIEPNQFIGDILSDNGVSYQKIAELENRSKDVFSVRKLKAGKNLTLIRKDECADLHSIVYEPDPFRYVLFDIADTVSVALFDREFNTCIEIATGVVESSLWNAMVDQGHDASLIDLMEDALAWSIDFYHTQKGDQYKLIFEQKYIDDEPVGIGKLLGAYYKNYDNEYYAIYFDTDEYKGFFDLEGRPTKKAFLKAPVKFSRISSRFNYNRYHPIKKRRIPHLGTDYAAPYGTPIRSVANGVVITASYTRGNGRYVKIKHDKTYTTQYLHMQKFAKGIKSGMHVKQGQTIGYVGSTGLATGPHVCFRFWKNGRQINHMRENFPSPEPMDPSYLPEFMKVKDDLIYQLDEVPFWDLDGEKFVASTISDNS